MDSKVEVERTSTCHPEPYETAPEAHHVRHLELVRNPDYFCKRTPWLDVGMGGLQELEETRGSVL